VTPPWEDAPLGKVATLQRGFDLAQRERKPGVIPIVTSSGFGDTHCESKVVGPGVVTGRYGTIGEVFYVQSDFWPLNTTLYVKDFHGNDPLFVSYLLRTLDFHTHSGKSGVPGVNRNDLHEVVVHFPRTQFEQKAIARVLSDADALIESLKQLTAKKRNLKQGTTQELLSGKERLPGFGGTSRLRKETDLGPLPVDWGVAKLGDCLSEQPAYGINAPAAPYRDNLPMYIRITDITDDGRFSPEKLVSVNAASAAHYFLEDGDLVFARTGASVGKSYRYRPADGRLVFAGFLIRVRPSPRVLNPLFLAAFVATARYRNWVRLMSMRSGQPGINGTEYAELPIPRPPIKEQTAIATILSDMDAEIAALEAKLAKARQIKQGMMQNLLTGRIRLV
jgi:type I restriction enzyme S subunit